MSEVTPTSTANSAPIRVQIVLPTNIYFLSGVRGFTLDLTKNVAGFDQAWAHRFQTVVDELANNAIEHGSRAGDDITLLFEIEREKAAQITVSDSGHGVKPLSAADLRELMRAELAEDGQSALDLRGRGFLVIRDWSDECRVADNPTGGLSVTVKKNYEAPPAPKAGFYHSEEGGDALVLDV